MYKVNSAKLAGLMGVVLACSLFYGCSQSSDKTVGENKTSPSIQISIEEQKTTEPEIPKPTDIEVRINAKASGLIVGSITTEFSEISYEGKVTNTGFQIAPITEVNLSWDAEWTGGYGDSVKCQARKVEIFRNLRPGETREFSGVMRVVPMSKVAKDAFSHFGGIPLDAYKKGVVIYNVKVYREK